MEQRLQQLTFGKAFVVSFVVALFYYFSMYDNGQTILNQIQSTQDQIQQQEKKLQTIKSAIADAERFQELKTKLGAELEIILKALPATPTAREASTQLMGFLSSEARKLALSIITLIAPTTQSSIPTTSDAPKPFFEPVPVTVSLEGNYVSLMLFLSAITKSDKIITLSNLSLSNKDAASIDDKGPAQTTLRLAGEFRAYRFLPPEGAKK